ncbi:hypothetical protein MY8738_006002 [Beauveria namnaoensis]
MNKLRAITTVRYHSVSILIHRPLLCVTLKYLSKINGRHDTELPYTTQLAMAEAFECISSAEETIGMAASVFGGGPVEDGNLVFTAALVHMDGVDFMRMVDLLDDDSGLGPYLAAELFDASTIDSLTLPL